MIRLTNISKIYHERKLNEVCALKDIELAISPAEFVILVGANGSGKSTLLNLIAGNVFPSHGNLEINGVNVTNLPDYKRSKWVARVFQNPMQGTAPDLSIIENFRLSALRTTSKKLKIGLNAAFTKIVADKIEGLGLGLEKKLNQAMGSLSGGQRQALSLLMTVMADVKVLLLDEPTAALDPRSAEIVLATADRLIKEYKITALMVTHNLKEAHQYGTRILQLQDGEILRDISKSEKDNLTYTDMYKWFI